jgi:hypothetical protein
VQGLICEDIFDAHDIWKIFQDLYDMPKCEDQDQRASMQSEATATNHSSSYAHDDVLAMCDLGFEHDKPSTREDQSANASSEGCSTSGAHTDALVITPKD